MILNNFRTMQRIGSLKGKPLSIDLVLEIHRIITERTLEEDSAAGRFRLPDERVVVYQTARTDLLDLERRGLLIGRKVGRTWYFTPATDLEDRLSRLDS